MGPRTAGFIAAFLIFASIGFAQDEVRVIVGFNGNVDAATFERHGGRVKNHNDRAACLAGTIRASRVANLRREPGVSYVEEDRVVTCHDTVDWGADRIKAPQAWAAGVTGSYGDPAQRVPVAVLDTGIDTDHPGLVGQWEVGKNCTTDYGSDPTAIEDGHSHGTHVSGTVAEANDGLGRIGVAHGAIVRVYKVLSNSGSGYTSWVVDGMTTASADGCRVFNMSYGSRLSSTSESNAVIAAWNGGAVLCGAAGNDGNSKKTYPAAYTNVIAVCATDSANKRASFSNYGSWTDISAPGVGITSTTNDGGYGTWNGTSMATPHVSGAAALGWAKLLGSGASNANNTEVRRRIELTKTAYVDKKKVTPGIVDCVRVIDGQ